MLFYPIMYNANVFHTGITSFVFFAEFPDL